MTDPLFPAPSRPSVASEWLGAALVFCIGLAIFYSDPIFSGFREIAGDKGDARFYVFHFEHWYKVFAGVARMADPPMFFPTPGTLGYADAQFAQALPYAVIKYLGADPFLAYQLMEFTQNLIGFAAMFALARYLIGASWWLAVAAAFAVAFAHGVHAQLAHVQILTLNYYPVILLFLVGAGLRLERSLRQAALLAAGGGMSLAALFFTGYYMGFFFVLLGGFATILYVAFDWRKVREFAARNGRRLAVVAGTGFLACLVGLIPFFMVHLPVVLDGAKRSFREVMHYAPSPADLLNVGSYNLLWGWLPQALTSLTEARLRYDEATLAPTPLLVLGAIGLWLWLLSRNRPQTKRQLRLSAALFFAGAILLVMTVNFGGTSGWWLIWKFVPGGTGLRVPFRIGISVSFALVLIVTLLGTALLKTAQPANLAWRHSILFALAILIAIGQISRRDAAGLDRVAENRQLAALPPPPRECRSFVAIDSRFKSRVPIHESIYLQTDAMLIAQQTGIPTINGYSSVVPPHWHMLRPDQRRAVANAHEWIRRHNLTEGACVYDRATNSWHVGTGKLTQ